MSGRVYRDERSWKVAVHRSVLENVTVLQTLTRILSAMQARLEWQQAVRFDAETETGHTVVIDGPEDSGGNNAGPRPMELMLLGVAGCTSYDVVHILGKSRVTIDGCTTQIRATRANEPPQVFETVHIHFTVSGQGLDEKKVARAVEFSAEKYCSASIMLQRAGVDVTHSFEVVAS